MADSQYTLTQIIYFNNELGNDSAFHTWTMQIKFCMPDIAITAFDSIHSFQNYVSRQNTPSLLSHNAIIIANSPSGIETAKALNIAHIGYLPDLDKFLNCSYVLQGLDEIDFNYIDMVFKRYHHIPLVITQTKRCIIREFCENDIDDLFKLYSSDEITRYVEPLFEYEEELQYQRNYIKYMYEYYGYGMWLVFDKETDSLIGRAGLDHRNYSDDETSEPEIEIGYLISPEFQHLGYATEVCSAIIEFARINLDVKRLNCLISPDNAASISLIEKLGFECVGTTELHEELMLHYIFVLHSV